MADRTFWTGVEVTGPTGRQLTDKSGDHFNTLFNSIVLRPTSITNTGNDYTIIIDPPLNPATDVIPPMSFIVKPNANNTGNARLRVTSGNPYYEVVKSNGAQFASGEFLADTNYLLSFLDGKFYALSASASGSVDVKYKYVLTASGSLDLTAIKATKHAKTRVLVQIWGGGGGGAKQSTDGGGGGGGGFVQYETVLEDLANSVAYTIGAGGAGRTTSAGVGLSGGNTTFNGVTAYGGGGGNTTTTNSGGGGGGEISAGTISGGITVAGDIGGGLPSDTLHSARTINGGGAGGGNVTAGNYFIGGNAVWGGGGGGGSRITGGTNLAGTSKFGGSGGAGSNTAGTVGTIPAGGGGAGNTGNGGDGARGEIRVFIG